MKESFVGLFDFFVLHPSDYLGADWAGFVDWWVDGTIDNLETVFSSIVSEADIVDFLENLETDPCQVVNNIMSDPRVSCGCTLLGYADDLPFAASGPIIEAGDCLCNAMQSLVNGCNYGTSSYQFIAQTILTAADCGNVGVSTLMGVLFSGGNPVAAGGVAVIADPIIDSGIMVAQNMINTGTPHNEPGLCDCLEVIQKLPNYIP